MLEFGIIDTLMVIVSLILIVLVGLQQSKQGFSDSFLNNDTELFKQQKERGAIIWITRLTYLFSVVFLFLGATMFVTR